MKRLSTITLMATAIAALASSAAHARAPTPDPVQVMVLGTWHFADPGLDLNNMKSDDVLKPRRQAELAAVADALAAFRPTKVMIEREAADAGLIDPGFGKFDAAMLASTRDERVQIGYRVARLARLDRVYAIDEQPADGEPDYFPFDKVSAFAKAHGQAGELDAFMAAPAAEMKAFEASQATRTMADLLIEGNVAKGFNGSMAGYYRLLSIGDTVNQPGADLNAMWYLRNAKIFAKLVTVTEPGDRVLVIYGAGHNYWLRHFAGEMQGFASVDPVPYLKRAGAKAK